MKQRLFTLISAAALACSIGPSAASAQMPSYAQRGPDSIHGRILSINDKYNISVRDDRGYVDNVTLHDGTIINPTGLTLAPGQTVTIYGHPAGRTFAADEIDTPYTSYYAYPVPYAVPVYPYPVYPYPAARFGIRFGGPYWGFGFRGPL